MNFYMNNGYVDFRKIRGLPFPFKIIVGGRGGGKTYGALETSIEDGIKFMFMRRRQMQVDIISNPDFSPIKPVARNNGWNITMVKLPHTKISAFVPYELDENQKQIITGPPYGYTCALSTFSNLRGFDASEVDITIFDEFIPEKGERPLKDEADTLFNAYESLNRNRELQGMPPMQLVCLSNANDQTAPVLERLRLIPVIDRMRKRGQELYTDAERGLCLLMLRDSPISAKKADTALYRLTAGSDFAEMALANDFSYEDRVGIISRPLTEYKPLFCVGEVFVYRHKSAKLYYATPHKTGTPSDYLTNETGLLKLRQDYGFLWDAYISGRFEFEDLFIKILLTKYMGW